jgi:hypothetical protein
MDINAIIAIADTHSGCRLALLPPEGIILDEGIRAMPSPFQMKLWDYWQDFWNVWVPMVTKKEKYAIVHVGDALDGNHHGSVSQITHNLADQAKIAEVVLRPVIEKAKGGYYHIRGTEAHVGPSGMVEEQLAKSLGAIPNDVGQYARYDLWKRIGPTGLVHFLHHIGSTGSTAYEATAVNKELTEEFVEAARWRDEPPNVIIRAHRHRHIKITIPTAKNDAIAEVLPGWQGKTSYVWKIPGGRLATPQFGGVLIKWGDEDGVYTRDRVYNIGRSATE